MWIEMPHFQGSTHGEDFMPTQYSYIGTVKFAGMMNRICALGNTMGSQMFNSVLVFAGTISRISALGNQPKLEYSQE